MTEQTNGPAANPGCRHKSQMALPWSCGPTSPTRSAEGRKRQANGLREVGLALVTAGLVVLLFVAYELVGTNLAEEHSQARLARDFNAAIASAPLRAGPSPRRPTTTRPLAPAPRRERRHAARSRRPYGVTGSVKPGPLDPSTLTEAAARHPARRGPRPFGDPGYRRRPLRRPRRRRGGPTRRPRPLPGDTFAWSGGQRCDRWSPDHLRGPFFRLNEVHSGDLVYLTDTLGTTWVYTVVSQFVVAPSDVAVLDATKAPELTLTTCNPRFEATSRLIVRAVLL